jgi:dihydrofolate reductase
MHAKNKINGIEGANNMTKIVLNMTMTFDGFFSGPNGELDWMVQMPDQELLDHTVSYFNNIDSGFIGYPTAMGMIPYWLNVAKNPSTSKGERAIATAVNKLRPFILSNKEEKLEWDNVKLLVVKNDLELVEAVTKIKQQADKDLGVPGGIRTAQTFARLGLIDEFVIQVHPVAIGAGKRIFMDKTHLELISTKTYKCGVMRVCYRSGSVNESKNK